MTEYLSLSGLTYYDQKLKEYFKVDTALNSASTYPVENKAIYFKLQGIDSAITNVSNNILGVTSGLTSVYNNAITYANTAITIAKNSVYNSAVTYVKKAVSGCQVSCGQHLTSAFTSGITYVNAQISSITGDIIEVYNSAVTYVNDAIDEHHKNCIHTQLDVTEGNGLYKETDDDGNPFVGVNLATSANSGTITSKMFNYIQKLMEIGITDFDSEKGIITIGGKEWQLKEVVDEEILTIYYGSSNELPTEDIYTLSNSVEMKTSSIVITPDTNKKIVWILVPSEKAEISKWVRTLEGSEDLNLVITEGDYIKGSNTVINDETYTLYYLSIVVEQGTQSKITLNKK